MKIRKVTVEQETANNLGNNKTANKNACQLLGQLVIVMYDRHTSPGWRWIIQSGNNTFQSAILNSHTRPHVQWALQAPITQAAHCTGCLKSSFLYFISLYFSTIGLGKKII